MKFRIILVWMLVFSLGMVVSAQEDDEEVIEPQGIYADIPQSRGEDGAFILGDPEAQIVIMEFADFLCPHCQDYHDEVIGDLIEQFVATGQARFEYRFFPIIDQTYSPRLAAVNECAYQQGLFWATHNELYVMAQDRLIGPDFEEILADRVGLDLDLLNTCLDSGDATQYETDTALGIELAVSGTPAVRVRVGDGEPGAIVLNGTTYNRGGVALSVLEAFITADDPVELIGDVVPPAPRLINEDLLQETGLISGDPCDAPCWRGIIPGETTWEDAVEIMQADETLGDLELQEQGEARGASFTQQDGILCCQIISQTGEFVEFIQLQIAPGVTLGEVIEKYGEPDYVDGEPYSSDQYILILFYEETPMLIYAFAPDSESALDGDSEIIGLVYLTDDLMEQFITTSDLAEWQGYESFDFYVGQ
ncbi:MAG: hypothetical protein D6711_06100 [Chloroflexi bacterium]|nr:MAG: hypothetical protein D6711_06100 [Chloroflexota bacterium]